MRSRKIIYFANIRLPKFKAHAIQIVRNCIALAARGAEVELFIDRINAESVGEMFAFYGERPPENLNVRVLPKVLPRSNQWKDKGFVTFILRNFLFGEKSAVFYLRDYYLARILIKLRPLVKIPIVFESHKIDGYFDAGVQGDQQAEREKGRGLRESEDRRDIDYCYANADGVISISKTTEEFINENFPRTKTLFAWHGTGFESNSVNVGVPFSERSGIYYFGNFYRYLRMETLIEAMKYVENEELFLVGGNDEEDVQRLRKCLKEHGVEDKVQFIGPIEPARVAYYQRRAFLVVATTMGLKLSEYMGNGLCIAAPNLPSLGDVFKDRVNCAMYEFDNPESLGRTINMLLADRRLAETLAENALKEASEYSWEKRADRILDFIDKVSRPIDRR